MTGWVGVTPDLAPLAEDAGIEEDVLWVSGAGPGGQPDRPLGNGFSTQ